MNRLTHPLTNALISAARRRQITQPNQQLPPMSEKAKQLYDKYRYRYRMSREGAVKQAMFEAPR